MDEELVANTVSFAEDEAMLVFAFSARKPGFSARPDARSGAARRHISS